MENDEHITFFKSELSDLCLLEKSGEIKECY